MKKISFVIFLISLSYISFGQSTTIIDSSRLYYVNGKCLNTCGQPYVQAFYTVFLNKKEAETYWSISWSGHDGQELLPSPSAKTNKDFLAGMKTVSKTYCLKDIHGEPIKITTELDLFNSMALSGYRYLKKELIPAMPLSFSVILPAVTAYTFEKK